VSRDSRRRILFAVNVAAAAFTTGLLGMAWPPVTRSVLVGGSVGLWLLAVLRCGR
jgi:hypothetical protein